MTPEEAQHKQRIDQAMASLRDSIPPILGSYFKALLEEGFSREEALKLTIGFQSGFFLMAGIKKGAA